MRPKIFRKQIHIIFQILTLFCWAGLIGIGDPKSLLTASAALNAFHVPVIAVDPAVFSQVSPCEKQIREI